jgi:hypothetical protein
MLTCKIWRILDIGKTFVLNFKICTDLEKNLNGRACVPAPHDGPWPHVQPAHARMQPCYGGSAIARCPPPHADAVGRLTATCLPMSTCVAPPVLIPVVARWWSKGPFRYFTLPLCFASRASAPHHAATPPSNDHRASSHPRPASEPHLITVKPVLCPRRDSTALAHPMSTSPSLASIVVCSPALESFGRSPAPPTLPWASSWRRAPP